MMTNRIQPPRNRDGSRQNYNQRANIRRDLDRDRRIAERQTKQQGQLEAIHKPSERRPPTADERREKRAAELEGKRLADARQAAMAAELSSKAGPTNPYRQRAAELEHQSYRPEAKKRIEHFTRLADQFDREQATAKTEAERQAKIAADPAVKLALENSEYVHKLADDADKADVIIAAELARAGCPQEYWNRIKPVEQRILAREERLTAERLAARNSTHGDYLAAVDQLKQVRERLDTEQAAPDLAAVAE